MDTLSLDVRKGGEPTTSALPWEEEVRPWWFRLLAWPVLGRPIRKLLYFGQKFFGWQLSILQHLHHHHPYVVSLMENRRRNFRPATIDMYYRRLRLICSSLEYQPKISVILPYYRVKAAYLREAIASVEIQAYQNWEICIVDDASGEPELAEVVRAAQRRHGQRIKYATLEKNGHICVATNRAFELADGDYVTFLDHDDRLMPNALGEMVRAINLHQEPDVLYSDEQLMDSKGTVFIQPFFKPSWSPTLLLSHNYITHLAVYRTDLVRRLGGVRPGFEGSQDHDLILRATEATKKPVIHVPYCLYQWRMHDESTASGESSKPYAAVAGEKAVREALERRGLSADVEWEDDTKHYRVKFALPSPRPKVSLVTLWQGQDSAADEWVAGLRRNSAYPELECIVVFGMGSSQRQGDSAAASYIAVQSDDPANRAYSLNLGAKHASGEYLIFVAPEVLPTNSDWIDELLRYGQFDRYGAVGCKVLYSDGTIEQAGQILIGSNITIGAGQSLASDSTSYWSVLQTPHEVAAIGSTCLLIKRQRFVELGEFDAVQLAGGYFDIDLCLRLKKSGYDSFYTPYATLKHSLPMIDLPSEVLEFERDVMMKRWAAELIADRYLNPNLHKGPHYHWDTMRPPLHSYWFAPAY